MERSEFESRLASARVLASDTHGVKVLETDRGEIIKMFRIKRIWSSAWIFPYHFRFSRNARILRTLGFDAPEVIGTYRLSKPRRDVVVYRKLEGRSLRELLADPAVSDESRREHIDRFAVLIARLHRQGIVFRSIHFGNVLVRPGGGLALIDVSDMRYSPWGGKLSVHRRIRNFHHFLRYAEDRMALTACGMDRFLDRYLGDSGLPPRDIQKMREGLSDHRASTH